MSCDFSFLIVFLKFWESKSKSVNPNVYACPYSHSWIMKWYIFFHSTLLMPSHAVSLPFIFTLVTSALTEGIEIREELCSPRVNSLFSCLFPASNLAQDSICLLESARRCNEETAVSSVESSNDGASWSNLYHKKKPRSLFCSLSVHLKVTTFTTNFFTSEYFFQFTCRLHSRLCCNHVS